MDISNMKIIDLKRELKKRGKKVTGNKTELIKRLKTNAKKRKLKVEEFSTNPEHPSILLKMPIEVLDLIFDYLNLKELSAVSATCKQMQQIAGRIYQQNYAGLFAYFFGLKEDWELKTLRLQYEPYIDINYFIPFVDKISCGHRRYLELHNPWSKFQQLKQLTIERIDFITFEIDSMKEILSKLEYLQIKNCKMDESFLESLLILAPNLKRLCLRQSSPVKTWLEHRYPSLEHCEILSKDTMPIVTLLTLNPNIRKFGTNAKDVWENRSLIKTAEVQLEELSIQIPYFDYFDQIELSFWSLMNELHELGVYKRFNLCCVSGYFEQNFVDRIANLTAISRLWVHSYTAFKCVALSSLTHLKDITFPGSLYITDIATVANRLDSLKFIHFGICNINHLKLFMGASSKLEILQIDWFIDEAGHFENYKALNLIDLNKERAKLSIAKKVTLFVQEAVYLVTKRAKREIDLDFINLRRMDSLNVREFDFEYPKIYMQQPCLFRK